MSKPSHVPAKDMLVNTCMCAGTKCLSPTCTFWSWCKNQFRVWINYEMRFMREIIFIMQSVCICMLANEAEASMCMFSPLCQSVCVCEYSVMTQLLTLIFRLTGVNEELVRDSGMVHVMNCTGKDGSEDLKVCEHSLERRRSKCWRESGGHWCESQLAG